MADVVIIGGEESPGGGIATYCTNDDIADEFGIATVNKWSNITGLMTAPEIETAKDKQRVKAFDYCNGKLRGGAYVTIPIAAADRPPILAKVEAAKAGIFPARKRPISKGDTGDSEVGSFAKLEKWIDTTLKDIRRGFYLEDSPLTRVPAQTENEFASVAAVVTAIENEWLAGLLE